MPVDWLTLCATVFALGLRHGLDADHLVAIDGMTRFNHDARHRLARWCGVLFSLGHGAVVVAVATTAQAVLRIDAISASFTKVGEWISVCVLTILGVLNLLQLLRSNRGVGVAPIGLLGRLLSRLTRTANPITMAAVGALFALSFDTLSQALLFSASASRFHGWRSAAILGGLFTLGMLLLDGLNGAWMAQLLDRADATARTVSRTLGAVVALLSLFVATVGALRLLLPRGNDVLEPEGGVLSCVLVALVVSFAVLLLIWQPVCKFLRSSPLRWLA